MSLLQEVTLLPIGCVPEAPPAIGAGRRRLAVRTEGQRANLPAASLQRGGLFAGRDIPQEHSKRLLVKGHSPRGQGLAIGSESEGLDVRRVPFELVVELAGGNGPEPDLAA